MKNNLITLSQFWFSMFISVLIFILFLDFSSSLFQLILTFLAIAVNLIVVSIYKGKPNFILKSVITVYLVVFSVLTVSKFVDFMNFSVNSQPYWAIAVILIGFTFFCASKGIEALARAAVIIGFFVIVFLLYIFVGSAGFLNLRDISFNLSNNNISSLVMMFPSAVYVMLYENINKDKLGSSLIYSVVMMLVTGFFTLLASAVKTAYPVFYISERSYVGIFKGADCLLLGILTLSVLYITSLSYLCIFKKSKQNYLTNGIFMLLILSLALVTLYLKTVKSLGNNQILLFILVGVMTGVIILSGIINRLRMNKNS